MKQAEREANLQKLGENQCSKILYRTLESHKREGEQKSIFPDPSTLTQLFTSTGKLSSKVPPPEQTFKTEKSECSIVLCETDHLEVAKQNDPLKTKMLRSRWHQQRDVEMLYTNHREVPNSYIQ